MSAEQINPEKIASAVERKEQQRTATQEARKIKRANKVANKVLRALQNDKTDVHLRPSHANKPEVIEKAKDVLGERGIEVDHYDVDHRMASMRESFRAGFAESEDRLAVTRVDGTKMPPSTDYARELEWRAEKAVWAAKNRKHEARSLPYPAASEAIRVAQTEKYARRVGDREYLTTDEPHGVVNFKRYASDEAYAEALSTKVIQCVDIMVYDPEKDTVLIGSRQQEPQAGDWVIGGGMRAGETVSDAAHRSMQRELHTEIDEDNLTRVGNYKFIWDSREQPPTLDEEGQEVSGCHTSSTLVAYPVSQEDINLEDFNEEYNSVGWVDTAEILGAPEGTYHPCLVDMVTDTKAALS